MRKTCDGNCAGDGVNRFDGRADDIVKRGQAHLRQKGVVIEGVPGLQNLSCVDARAVEQTLISYHGLGKDGGTLINKINSISSVKAQVKCEQVLIPGVELLKNDASRQPPGHARHRLHQQQPWRGDSGARNQCDRADRRHHQQTHRHHIKA